MSILHFMDEEKRKRLLVTALDVFFKHGYKRVEMKEIAQVAGISRPGLYLYFKTKEEIFSAAILEYAETKLTEIAKNIGSKKSLEEKLQYAFEVWSVRNFDRSLESPEAKEVSDCSLAFASEALRESYQKLETIIAQAIKTDATKTGASKTSTPKVRGKSIKKSLPAQKTAHLLVSATRGFKMVARNSGELRKMIQDLLEIVL